MAKIILKKVYDDGGCEECCLSLANFKNFNLNEKKVVETCLESDCVTMKSHFEFVKRED